MCDCGSLSGRAWAIASVPSWKTAARPPARRSTASKPCSRAAGTAAAYRAPATSWRPNATIAGGRVMRRVSGSSPAATRSRIARDTATSSAGSSWNARRWSLSGCGNLRARVQVERAGVDAVALAGRAGAVREHVPEVAAAGPARHFRADHPVAAVLVNLDVRVLPGLGEARPAGAGIELGVRAEQLGSAARAAVDPVVLHVHVAAGERPLGALLAQDLVLLRRELLTPLLICLLDLRSHE